MELGELLEEARVKCRRWHFKQTRKYTSALDECIWMYSAIGRERQKGRRYRRRCQLRSNLGRGKASLFIRRGWRCDNTYWEVDKEVGSSSRSYWQRQSKRAEGGK